MKMNVPPSVISSEDDTIDENDKTGGQEMLKARGESRLAPIAIIGAGPAGLTCATFLSRLGYKYITVYESGTYAGGLRYVNSFYTRTSI